MGDAKLMQVTGFGIVLPSEVSIDAATWKENAVARAPPKLCPVTYNRYSDS